MSVPVIDLFAGPGGLGEGFSRYPALRFDIAVSIEKDAMAHQTLRLRAAHRALMRDDSTTDSTWQVWDSIVETEPWDQLFKKLSGSGDLAISRACELAEQEALNLELGPSSRDVAATQVRARLAKHMKRGQLPQNAVLIGGPPCQAFSVVGRSRNKGTKGYKPEEDHRHFLYLEYLRVIAEFKPAVFVMENVKGILTSRVLERQMFQTILRDLKQPGAAAGIGGDVEYELRPLREVDGVIGEFAPDDFIVRAEEYGVPQARHRVIILGVRKDVFERAKSVDCLSGAKPPTVAQVINDLPRLRPELSFRGKGLTWQTALELPLFDKAIKELQSVGNKAMNQVAHSMVRARAQMQALCPDPGSGHARRRLTGKATNKPAALPDWYQDRQSTLLTNHESRAHMPTDLVRYLFVAAFGQVEGSSPRLKDFPKCLLPAHKNVDPNNAGEAIFKDRFRVQVADQHSMTITSHIAKDGHAFIHHDAGQCRSLTVREAARLQTFPDTYVFLGNRTSQYTQVGNAVPPLLAEQIAKVVAGVLTRAGLV